jgi:hypothetical protein
VGQVFGRAKTKAVFPGGQHISIGQTAGRPNRVVVHAYNRADQAARGLRRGRQLEPLIERAALVRFEVAEGDPTQLRRIQHAADSFAHQGKHGAQARMKQQRFVVPNQEVVELQLKLRHVYANAMHVRGNLVDSRSRRVLTGILCISFLQIVRRASTGGKRAGDFPWRCACLETNALHFETVALIVPSRAEGG